MDLAALPQKMGGLGVRDPVPAAVTLYISTQSRIIPKVEDLLEDHLEPAWTEDPELNNYIWAIGCGECEAGIHENQINGNGRYTYFRVRL